MKINWREVAKETGELCKSLSYMLLMLTLMRLIIPVLNPKDTIETISSFFVIYAIVDICSTLKKTSDKLAKEGSNDGKKVRRARRTS